MPSDNAASGTRRLFVKRIGYRHSLCRGWKIGFWTRRRKFYVSVTRWAE